MFLKSFIEPSWYPISLLKVALFDLPKLFYKVFISGFYQNQEYLLTDFLLCYKFITRQVPQESINKVEQLNAYFSPQPFSFVRKIHQKNFTLWKRRLEFIHDNNNDIFLKLLSRIELQSNSQKQNIENDLHEKIKILNVEDYFLSDRTYPETVKLLTTFEIYEWLITLNESEKNNEISISEWVNELEDSHSIVRPTQQSERQIINQTKTTNNIVIHNTTYTNQTKTTNNNFINNTTNINQTKTTNNSVINNNNINTKSVRKPPKNDEEKIAFFYQLFKGENDEEKKEKFNTMIECLKKGGHISDIDTSGKYKWEKTKSSRNLCLAGLCRVLNTKYLENIITSKSAARLLGQWLRLDKGIKSIHKKLQPAEQDKIHEKYMNDYEDSLHSLVLNKTV